MSDSERARDWAADEARNIAFNAANGRKPIGHMIEDIRAALLAAEARGRAAGRLDGIEEAAHWHDKHAASLRSQRDDKNFGYMRDTIIYAIADHDQWAKVIRALAEKEPSR
jgi:hypothetical protein